MLTDRIKLWREMIVIVMNEDFEKTVLHFHDEILNRQKLSHQSGTRCLV